MKLINLTRLVVVLVCLTSPARKARADEFEDLKASIQERAPTVNDLKTRGILKEGSNGFLLLSQEASAEAQKTLEAENTARLKMFGIVADRSGIPIEKVAQGFAKMVPAIPSTEPSKHPSAAASSHKGFVPVRDGSSLPLKILSRPNSSLYAAPLENSQVLKSDVPAFTAYVVAALENGWYKVAEKIGTEPVGWMKGADVMEWKHHMVVSFTHPGKRSRNIVFKDKEILSSLLRLPDVQRKAAWSRYLQDSVGGFGGEIVGVEPEGWLRGKNQFYLLPILDQHEVVGVGQEVMLLKIAAATRERGTAKPTTVLPSHAVPKMDIVFVMDLTRSMGPFVTKTLEMLSDIASRFDDSEIGEEAVRFGLWGYRDDPSLISGIEFNTHNFTPEMQDLRTFVETLKLVSETKVDSIDYAEDVFAGVSDAISKTHWRKGAVKSILLVGDAPGRGPSESEQECRQDRKPKGSAAKMDASALRALATANSVYLAAFYLEASKWKIFTARGATQFKSLALNPGSSQSDFAILNADNPNDYAAEANAYASGLAANLKSLAAGNKIPSPDSSPDGDKALTGIGRSMADNLFRNAFIEWNSANRDLPAPRDIEGWMIDKDPADSSRMSLEPGVLLTKTQLSDLHDRLNEIIDAMIRVEQGSQDFFKQLHAVVTIGSRDPGKIRESKTLMESDHFPDFLSGLPYKSKIMGMTKDDWREMSADRLTQYLNEIVSKVGYYAEIYKDSSKWQKLNSNADSGDEVTPIPIDMLP